MYGLTDDEKLEQILRISTNLGVTANDFGENTKISTMGAHNILTGKSKNPRTKNLNTMLLYLESLEVGKSYKSDSITQKVEEASKNYNNSLEEIIFNKMYANIKPELDAMKIEINNLEIEINKLKNKK